QQLKYKQFSDSALIKNYILPDTTMQNTAVEVTVRSREDTANLSWRLQGKYDFYGVNKSDYSLSAEIHLPLNRFGNIDLKAFSVQKSPSFISERYVSNHFIWKNDFDPILTNSVSIKYELPEYHLSIGAEV